VEILGEFLCRLPPLRLEQPSRNSVFGPGIFKATDGGSLMPWIVIFLGGPTLIGLKSYSKKTQAATAKATKKGNRGAPWTPSRTSSMPIYKVANREVRRLACDPEVWPALPTPRPASEVLAKTRMRPAAVLVAAPGQAGSAQRVSVLLVSDAAQGNRAGPGRQNSSPRHLTRRRRNTRRAMARSSRPHSSHVHGFATANLLGGVRPGPHSS